MSEHHQSLTSMEDLEDPFLSDHHRRRRRCSCGHRFRAIGYSVLQTLFVFLVLASIRSFIFISKHEDVTSQESNVESAVISCFNLSTSSSEVNGSWNVTLSLNKDVTSFKYEGRAWLYRDNEFMITTATPSMFYDSEGHQAFEYGNFTMEKRFSMLNEEPGFLRDRDFSFDLLLEANVTYDHRSGSNRRAFLMIDCNELKIDWVESNVGTLTGGSKSCRVQRFPSRSDALLTS